MADSLRVDKFLWFARLAKTRSFAQEVAEAGHMRISGRIVDLRGVNEALVPVRLGMPAVPPGRSAAATFGNRAVGSNNWAMAGARTRSGAALVANDMHLGLAIPNTWYRVRLQFRNLAQPDLCGVTLPGVAEQGQEVRARAFQCCRQ